MLVPAQGSVPQSTLAARAQGGGGKEDQGQVQQEGTAGKLIDSLESSRPSLS